MSFPFHTFKKLVKRRHLNKAAKYEQITKYESFSDMEAECIRKILVLRRKHADRLNQHTSHNPHGELEFFREHWLPQPLLKKT